MVIFPIQSLLSRTLCYCVLNLPLLSQHLFTHLIDRSDAEPESSAHVPLDESHDIRRTLLCISMVQKEVNIAESKMRRARHCPCRYLH